MIPSAGSNILILLVLFAVFAGSWLMFWVLIERATSQRQSVALVDWGKDHGLRLRECSLGLPEPFNRLAKPPLKGRLCLSGKAATLLQLESDPSGPRDGTPARLAIWNVLVQPIEREWPPTGLRPTANRTSVLDLFALTSFPDLGATDRFVVFGTDTVAAERLSMSSARGLLPPDIGLLLHGRTLLLDFSARPFDEIEFNRMLVLAEQIRGHV